MQPFETLTDMSTRADQSRRKKKAVSKSVVRQHTTPLLGSHSSAGTSSTHDQGGSQSTPADADIRVSQSTPVDADIRGSQSTPADADILENLLPFIGSDHIDDHDDADPDSTHASVIESSASIGRIGIIQCHKGRGDFSSGIVTDCIRDLILSRVNHFWPKFSEIPVDVKDVMFKDFLSKFQWKPDTSEAYIRKIWEQKAGIKYKEMVHEMKKNRKKAKGIAQEIYSQFELYWEREDVKARAQKNAANRAQNKRLHIGGSRSFADYQQDLSKEYRRDATRLGGVSPDSQVRVESGVVRVG